MRHTSMMTKRTLRRRARSVTLGLLALLLVLGCVRAEVRAQSGGAQAAAPRMSVLFTAMGRDKKFITTLRPEDVRLSVDGAARELLELRPQTEFPLFIAIVIDTSASQ